MPRLWFLSPALLAACAAAPPPAEIPVRGETPGHICKAIGTAKFIGRSKTSKTAAAIKRATGAAVLRWALAGDDDDNGLSRRPGNGLPRSQPENHQNQLRLGRFGDHLRFNEGAADGRQGQPRALGDGEPVDRFDRPLRGPIIPV